MIYALLVEHANDEQITEINRVLDEDVSGGADDFTAILERAVTSEQL